MTSTTVAPSRSFSSVAVPSAITLPWSMTTMLSASRSASSRYCVVSSTVVPLLDERPRSRPTARCGPAGRGRWWARRGTAPAGGARARRRGRAAGACRPSRCATTRSAASVSAKLLEQLVGPGGDLGRRQVRELADQREVLAAGEVLVDRGVLAGEADAARAPAAGPCARRRRAPRAVPPSGLSSVVRIRTAVVLPAPLGPSRPSTLPSGTSNETPFTASTSPKHFTRSVGHDRRSCHAPTLPTFP